MRFAANASHVTASHATIFAFDSQTFCSCGPRPTHFSPNIDSRLYWRLPRLGKKATISFAVFHRVCLARRRRDEQRDLSSNTRPIIMFVIVTNIDRMCSFMRIAIDVFCINYPVIRRFWWNLAGIFDAFGCGLGAVPLLTQFRSIDWRFFS